MALLNSNIRVFFGRKQQITISQITNKSQKAKSKIQTICQRIFFGI